MANILVRGVPDDVASRLKERAKRNRRSLQQEMLTILERAAHERMPMTDEEREEAWKRAQAIRERLAASGRVFSDSTELIRANRDGCA